MAWKEPYFSIACKHRQRKLEQRQQVVSEIIMIVTLWKTEKTRTFLSPVFEPVSRQFKGAKATATPSWPDWTGAKA